MARMGIGGGGGASGTQPGSGSGGGGGALSGMSMSTGLPNGASITVNTATQQIQVTHNGVVTTVPFVQPEPCRNGVPHEVDIDHIVTYIDGVSMATCSTCEDTIKLPLIPQGDLVPQLKSIIDHLMTIDPSNVTEYDEALKTLIGLGKRIQGEFAALNDAKSTFELAEAIVRKKWPD